MFSVIPPVGVPFDWRTIFASRDHAGEFAKNLSALLGGECTLTSSGKTALWLVLTAMHDERPARDEVIIPDYTCWTVPSAVVRAGLKVAPVDLEPKTLGLDPSSVRSAINTRTLAVVAPHLFGIPCRIDEIEAICREKQVYLIDDAAQAFGASLKGRPTGAFGDAGILSFGRGKNITTGNGGAVVVRTAGVRLRVHDRASTLPVASGGGVVDTAQMAVYKLFFSRRLFWIPASLPFLKLGETVYDTEFDLALLSADRAGRGIRMLKTYDTVLRQRQLIAQGYRTCLVSAKGLNVTDAPSNSSSADLRFPVILADKGRRDAILRRGRKFGISGMYPDTVSSVHELGPHLVRAADTPVARLVADQLITLPTHFGITQVDIEQISRFLMQAAE